MLPLRLVSFRKQEVLDHQVIHLCSAASDAHRMMESSQHIGKIVLSDEGE